MKDTKYDNLAVLSLEKCSPITYSEPVLRSESRQLLYITLKVVSEELKLLDNAVLISRREPYQVFDGPRLESDFVLHLSSDLIIASGSDYDHECAPFA